MSDTTRTKVEDRLRTAAVEAEAEVRRMIAFFNDEVVPDVRRNGSQALRTAAAELHRLAAKMDEAGRPTPPPTHPTERREP